MELPFNKLGINEIENFHKLLLNEINSIKEDEILELDFKTIENIDLCAIQLLISLKKTCKELNIKVNCINIDSRQLKLNIKMFKIEELLGISL